jgi:hypothetical protein
MALIAKNKEGATHLCDNSSFQFGVSTAQIGLNYINADHLGLA